MSGAIESTPGAPVIDLEFAASFEAVSAAGESMAGLLSRQFGEEVGVQLRLGIVEAMTNVVEHGCAGQADGRLRLQAVAGPTQWCFTLTDNGAPIPPAALAGADGSVFDFDPDDVAAWPEGGMGLSLIRMVFDRVDYQTSSTGNQLTLTAALPS